VSPGIQSNAGSPVTSEMRSRSAGEFLSGVLVLGGPVEGIVDHGQGDDGKASILIGKALTLGVALSAVEAGSRAIITEGGSFACHGANLLRCADREITWITGVEDALAQIPPGASVRISGNGVSIGERPGVPTTVSLRRRLTPTRSREVVRWNPGDGTLTRNYWPHRTYDMLAASVMIPGLQQDCARLTGKRPTISHQADGSLWFSENAPSVSWLTNLIGDPSAAGELIDNQLREYRQILREVATLDASRPSDRDGLRAMAALLGRYFSQFLLLHDTYEYVLADTAAALAQEMDEETAASFMDSVMTCGVLRWQLDLRLVLPIEKDLFQLRNPVPLPTLGPIDDAQTHASDAVTTLATSLGPAVDTTLQTTVEHAARVVVAKEWKFLLNKILFSRVGTFAARAADGDASRLSAWRSHSMEEMADLL